MDFRRGQGPAENAKRRPVVVVEDDPAIGKLTEYMLSREGYDIVLATGGRAGIEAIRKHRPIAVLVDLTLPDMTGDDVCRAVREDSAICNTYLVILTARDEMEARNRARQCGADAYACKPCDPDRLVELIEQGFGAAAAAYAPGLVP